MGWAVGYGAELGGAEMPSLSAVQAEEIAELGGELKRLRALQAAAEKWHDSANTPDIDEIEGALVIAIEQANPAKYGA
jgi:hypothetical protein